jgi:hypothetical protein
LRGMRIPGKAGAFAFLPRLVRVRFLGRRGGAGTTHCIKTASEKRPGAKSRLGKRQR